MKNLKSCCEDMEYYTDNTLREEHEIIEYHPEVRKYSFTLHGNNFGLGQNFFIAHGVVQNYHNL